MVILNGTYTCNHMKRGHISERHNKERALEGFNNHCLYRRQEGQQKQRLTYLMGLSNEWQDKN